MKRLLRCPFCGGCQSETGSELAIDNMAQVRSDLWVVRCYSCKAIGPEADSAESAAQKWNWTIPRTSKGKPIVR